MKYLIVLIIFVSPFVLSANSLIDSDLDGVPDIDEINIYKTDKNNRDTDGDGYSDWVELINGYSPHNPEGKKLEDCDTDKDGLSDRMELNFHTDILNSDTDNDGYLDGVEIENGYDPNNSDRVKLPKRIEITTARQEMSYFLGDVRMGKFSISTGKTSTPTPKGSFSIKNKSLKAWSSYGLWMPFWMSITDSGKVGIHELPIWPNGYREGEDHLGKPVSHGCVRLGIGSAEYLYNWAEIGTPVNIN